MSTIIINQQARFTCLTDGVMRMEYHPEGHFEDRPTVRVSERPTAKTFESHEEQDDRWLLRTPRMTIRYRPDGRPFDASNLEITHPDGSSWWTPDRIDEANLGGAYLSMDNMSRRTIPHGVHPATSDYFKNDADANLWRFRRDPKTGEPLDKERYESIQLEHIVATKSFDEFPPFLKELLTKCSKYPPGLLSRAGYFLYNDGASPALNSDGWITPRMSGGIDWYFFGYGSNFKSALKDLTIVFGRTPMPPRYSLGCWYSRYPTFKRFEFSSA